MAEVKSSRYVRRSTSFNTEGYLEIKGGLISSWKQKYFKAVFNPPQLVCYEKKDGKLVERIPLDKDVRLIDGDKSAPKGSFAFTLNLKGNKPYALSAQTEDERKEWLTMLNKCLAFAKQIAEGTTDSGLFSSAANGAPDGDAVLVFGAGCELGNLIVNYLLDARVHVYAALRPEEAEMDKSTARGAGRITRDALAKRGANICIVDTKNEKSVDAAFRGVNRVILLSPQLVNPLDSPPTPPDYGDVITAESAIVAGIKRASSNIKSLVRVSLISAFSNSAVALLSAHGKCDSLLVNANVPYAILQCGIFMQYIAFLHREIKSQNQLFGASGGGQRYGMVDMRDVARAATAITTGLAHVASQLNSGDGKRYRMVTEVASDEDIVKHINAAISPSTGELKKKDQAVTFLDMSDDEYMNQLRKLGAIPEYALPVLVSLDRIKREGTAQSTRSYDDFRDLMNATNNPMEPKALNVYVRDHLPLLSDKVAAAGFGLTILVTGATSLLGQATVRALASRYPTLSSIRAGVRNLEKGNALFKGLRNVKVVQCDTWKKDALPPAFAGVDSVLLIPPPDKELGDIFTYTQAIKAAKTIKLVAVVSHFCAGDQSRSYGRIWGSIEEEVAKTGIPYAFLRSSFFMENQLIQLGRMKDKGILQWPAAPDARISHIAVNDVGYCAAAVLVQPTKFVNVKLSITGPDAMTFNELAGRFTSVLGKQISYVRCKPDETLHYDYERVYSKWQSDALLELWEDVNQQKLAAVSTDAQALLGEMKPTSSEQFAREKILPTFEERKEHKSAEAHHKKDASTALLPGAKDTEHGGGYGTMTANRTLVMNNFRAQQTYTYDVVMVFKVGSPDKKLKMVNKQPDSDKPKKEIVLVVEEEYFRNLIAETVEKLHNSGLQTDMWYSVQKDEIYVRIGASEERMALEADRGDYDLELDGAKCLAKGRELGVRLAVLTPKEVPETAWQNLFGKYDRPVAAQPWRHELYKRHNVGSEWAENPHYNSLFTPIDRIKLVSSIIKGDTKLGGAELPIKKMITNATNPLSAFFPLHSDLLRDPLFEKLTKIKSAFSAPLQDVRDYFGESIGFYFAFLSYYNRSLILPAVIGLLFFLLQIGQGRIDVDALPVYAIFVALWATLFLEYWKRQEATYRIKWGMSHFLEKETARPEFKGQWQPSPVDGSLTEIFPFQEKLVRLLLSQSVIFSLIAIVIGCVASIFVLRGVMAAAAGAATGNIITAIINAIQINILNVVYGKVAFRLTEYENHRTDTQYENSLIAKTFLFKFVNSYNSMFYVAFLKKFDRGDLACNPDCLSELRVQLATIFITQMVVGNFTELFLPWLKTKLAAKANTARGSDGNIVIKSKPEEEYELEAYEGTFVDFDEMVIQFGYVTLFVVAFPITPLLALASNVLEMRVDSTKLCKLVRRPEPRGAANIGTWFDILNLVSFIAVMTNAAVVCFETPKMDEWFPEAESQAFCFLLAEHAIMGLKFAVGFFVPDEPPDVTLHIMRQEYLVGVLLQGVEEEEDENVARANAEEPENEVTSGSNRQLDLALVSDNLRVTDHDV